MLRNVSHKMAQKLRHANSSRYMQMISPIWIRKMMMTNGHLQKDEIANDGDRNVFLERIKRELEVDKATLKWRTPSGEAPGDWNSKFKLFENAEQTSDYLVLMQKPIDLSPSSIKRWWKKTKENHERLTQQYIPERIEILGVELAAAHFILYRGGAVKFVNHSSWMRAKENGEFDLPNRFDPAYKIEALRCDNMRLYYEGLENLRCLQYLKFLSFHNVKTFDDWSLDRVSGSQYTTLETLDISGTNCTQNGLTCLYRIPSLKLLIVDDPKKSLNYELSCAMLEEALPNLKVIPAAELHEEKSS